MFFWLKMISSHAPKFANDDRLTKLKLLMKISVVFKTCIFEFLVQFFVASTLIVVWIEFSKNFLRFIVKAITKTKSLMRWTMKSWTMYVPDEAHCL